MFENIIFILLCIIDAAMLVFDISVLISVFKAKEKAVVTSFVNLSTLFGEIALVIMLLFLLGKTKCIIMLGVFVLLFILQYFTFISPEGICTSIFNKNGGIIPKDSISYEYSEKKLKLHINGSKKPLIFDIGTTHKKTIKMLADNYPKHGYENPLLK